MSTTIPAHTLEKFTTFGDLLRFLRRRVGITQMELASMVGYSDAQISRLEQNLRLPDLPTIEARFVPALGIEDEPRVITRLLDLAANIRREDAPGLGLCPYKGLNYFDEADADLFTGREELTTKLTEKVISLAANSDSGQPRFLAVIGASGGGKSSLVRAGLVPTLRWDKRSAGWNIYVLIPTAHPLKSLADAISPNKESNPTATTLVDDFSRDIQKLHVHLREKISAEGDNHVLIVIDQFEEVFAICRSEEERAYFIGNLVNASSKMDGTCMVLITLRADFYAYCANYPELRDAIAKSQEYIGAMDRDELRRAIEEPAHRGRWEFEPGLVDLILRDIGNEPGSLPLLSHALFETWHRRRGRMLTMSGYASSGGVRGAISETAESVFADQFNHKQKLIARRIFLRLTELGDDEPAADTRRRALIKELITRPEDRETTISVLKALADARLIVTSESSAEVAHEALIREWATLRNWLNDNRANLRLHRQLTEAAQEWSATGHSPDILYRGTRLAQAREWADNNKQDLNAVELEFLTESVNASEREIAKQEAQRQREIETAKKLAEFEHLRAEEQARNSELLRKRALYLLIAFIVTLAMTYAAIQFGLRAQTSSRIASSRELAAASINNLEVDPVRSILLALKAMEAENTIEAENALHRAVQASRIMMVVQAHEPGSIAMVAFSPDGSQIVTSSSDKTVKIWNASNGKQVLKLDGFYAAWNPNGKSIAVVSEDGSVKIFEKDSGEEIPLAGNIYSKLSVTYSPDGTQLATTTSGNTPTIWDLKSGRELIAFQGHNDLVSNLVFSPNGKQILSASDDGKARVWDVSTGAQLLEVSAQSGFVWSAAYSPDGRIIAIANDNEINLWDAATGVNIQKLPGTNTEIYAIAFSHDNTYIAAGGLDRKIRIWDASSGEELYTFSGHTGAIYGLSFNPTNTNLASISDDGTLQIWDLTPAREFLTIPISNSSGQIAYSRDGKFLAGSFSNGSIKIWDAHTGMDIITFPVTGEYITDLVFDPSGTYLFSSSRESTLTMWNTITGKKIDEATVHSGPINGLAVSPDGKYLATASNDYKVKLWDISPGSFDNPIRILDHPGAVNALAFNNDGTSLVTGAQDGVVRLWDITTGKEIATLRDHADQIMSVAFSLDGAKVVSAGLDGKAIIWDLSTANKLTDLIGHTNSITSAAFNPDGSRIATVSRDGATKLWDTVTGNEILSFAGDGSGLSDVAFSPDGKLLSTSGENGVWVYILDIEDLISLAQTRVTRELTSEECQKYLHLDKSNCSPSQTIPTTTAIPITDKGRVCQVTNTGGLYDNSFNEMIYKGLQDSARLFDWDAQVFQPTSTSDYEKYILEFVRGDCDLIIGLLQMADAIQSAARSNPQQKFLIMDYLYEQPLDNIRSQVFATDQAAFLAGYTAASVTKTGKVGVFGGIDFPPVTDFMDGYSLGVEYYNLKHDASVEVIGWDPESHSGLFLGGFCCSAEGWEITQELLDQGADVILPVAGTSVGSGAANAVKTHRNAYIIGVDSDWAITNPEFSDIILTSIVKNYDLSVVEAVKTVEENTFSGGTYIGAMGTGEVSLAPFYGMDAIITADIKMELEQIETDIILGKIKTKP